MKDIKYPIESFFWHQHDEQGNVIREIRDADRNTVFFMRIKGRDSQEAARFTENIVPLVIKLLNENASGNVNHLKELVAEVANTPISNGKATLTQSERMKAYWAAKRAEKAKVAA